MTDDLLTFTQNKSPATVIQEFKQPAYQVTLPFPPSVNHYWRSLRRGPLAGRVIISAAGKQYRKTVAELVRLPPGWNASARVGVAVVAFVPDRRRRDLDNLLKPLLDSLQHANVFEDDCQVDDLRVSRGHIVKDGLIDLLVQPLAEEKPRA